MQTALLLLQTAIRFFVAISGGYTNYRLVVAYLNIENLQFRLRPSILIKYTP
ncbi:hypothetical protein [Pedobacter sp.]|uniref:hypothetical protein n=1 Tax=Pedobacter sp. TaxID=1411316 RepID=UPI00396C74D6